jgi:hypothetical protein
MTGNLVSLPAIFYNNHPKKTVVHSYQRSFLQLLKMFTGVALLTPGGHGTGFGGALVSATWTGRYYEGGGHGDQKVTTL